MANRQANYQPMRRVADLLSPSKRAATPPTKKGRLRTLANDVRIVCPGSLDEGGRSRDAQSFRADLQRILRAGPPGRSAAFARTGRRSGSRNPLAVEHKTALRVSSICVYCGRQMWVPATVSARVLAAKTFSECQPDFVLNRTRLGCRGASLQRFTVHEKCRRGGTERCLVVP